MEFTFTHMGYQGRVMAWVERTLDPALLGAWEGAKDLANCTATIEFDGRGYLQRFGWVQLVRSTDNVFAGEAFEMDPFDPFGRPALIAGMATCQPSSMRLQGMSGFVWIG